MWKMLLLYASVLIACEERAVAVLPVDVTPGMFLAMDAEVPQDILSDMQSETPSDTILSEPTNPLDAALPDAMDVPQNEPVRDVLPDPATYSETDVRARRVFVTVGSTYVTAEDGSFWGWGSNGNGSFQPAGPYAPTLEDNRVRPQMIPRVQDVRDVSRCLLAGPEGRGSIYCLGRSGWLVYGAEGDTWAMWRYPRRLGEIEDVVSLGPPEGCVRADRTYWEFRRIGDAWFRDRTHAGSVLGVASPGVYWLPEGVEAIPELSDRFAPGLHRVDGIVAMKGDGERVCMLLASGRVSCWGVNTSGEAGNFDLGGTCTPLSPASGYCVRVPTEIPGLTDVVQIALSWATTCARRRDGTVWCWGRQWPMPDGLGSIGDGRPADETCGVDSFGTTTRCRRRPVQVMGLGAAVDISVIDTHACAVLATGVTMCWGRNDHGQLGDGTTRSRGTPAPVRWH